VQHDIASTFCCPRATHGSCELPPVSWACCSWTLVCLAEKSAKILHFDTVSMTIELDCSSRSAALQFTRTSEYANFRPNAAREHAFRLYIRCYTYKLGSKILSGCSRTSVAREQDDSINQSCSDRQFRFDRQKSLPGATACCLYHHTPHPVSNFFTRLRLHSRRSSRVLGSQVGQRWCRDPQDWGGCVNCDATWSGIWTNMRIPLAKEIADILHFFHLSRLNLCER